MIKIEVRTPQAGVRALTLTSNNLKVDQDALDLIGNLIMYPGEKRGRYLLNGSMEILIKEKIEV